MRTPIEIDSKVFKREYGRYMTRQLTKTQLAEVLGVSRPTLDRIIKRQANGANTSK